MIDFAVARDKLLQFQTPEEIASFFNHQQIIGIKGNFKHCVVARWMQEQTGTWVIVTHSDMWDLDSISSNERHSEVLKKFIVSFDAGEYPELEEYDG